MKFKKTVIPLSERSSETRVVEEDVPGNRIYTAQITRLTRERRWKEAQEIFEQIEQKNTIVYGAMLAGARRCGQYQAGLELFQEMISKNFVLTEPVYVSAIALYSGCGRYSDGLELFRTMQADGAARNAPPYAAAMELCSKNDDYAGAQRIWADMLQAGVKPSSAAFTMIMGASANAGDLAAVKQYWQDLWKFGVEPNAAHLGCLLKACRTQKDASRARMYLEDKVTWPGERTVIHFTIVMSIYRTTGLAAQDWNQAEASIAELEALMKQQQVVPDRFFLEEHVAALLGCGLKDIVDGSYMPPAVAVKAAIGVLARAEQSGLEKTLLTSRVERLMQKTAVAQTQLAGGLVLPQGWVSTVDPKSGRPYYWKAIDPTGTVTWQMPT